MTKTVAVTDRRWCIRNLYGIYHHCATLGIDVQLLRYMVSVRPYSGALSDWVHKIDMLGSGARSAMNSIVPTPLLTCLSCRLLSKLSELKTATIFISSYAATQGRIPGTPKQRSIVPTCRFNPIGSGLLQHVLCAP